ncbi:alcohol oxidase-like protein [Coniochaeta sp. 2T2.1]|nr:alcohol oxidase-like protein [Coniochaeta sp. 2T2.1]
MPLYNTIPDSPHEVDIIIAGGGTAGCTLAGRLSAADPSLSVLLIEGGRDTYSLPTVDHMGFVTYNLAPRTLTANFYKANREEYLAGREVVVPAGGSLGGGSAVNMGLYTRAQRVDYDSWKTPGWSTKELRPYLDKIETYHGPGLRSDHGHWGPIHISDGGYRHAKMMDDYGAAAEAAGWREYDDLQSLEDNNGVQKWLRTVTPEGYRSTAAKGYIHPLLRDGKHPNLHVLTETHVVRVIIEGDGQEKRAVGVEVTPNGKFAVVLPGAGGPGAKTALRARKLVVLSAGGLGSAPILERSGVGSAEVLRRAGVEVVEDLPGVGFAYQDHPFSTSVYKTNFGPGETMDLFYTGQRDVEQAIAEKDPMLRTNGIDYGSKLRPSEEDVERMGPEFRAYWEEHFKNEPNRPMMFCGTMAGFVYTDATAYQPGAQYFTSANILLYPRSRGHVHITGPDVSDRLDFETGFLKDSVDVPPLVWAYKTNREITRRTSFYRGELAATHPSFPAGSAAAARDYDGPLLKNSRSRREVENIEYTPEDDEAIEEFLRRTVGTTWHSLGTCMMAPREEMGVVDRDLNVYGIKGLKVVDVSIPPENIGGNTNNTAFLIGEKGAAIVAGELGLKLGTTGKLIE